MTLVVAVVALAALAAFGYLADRLGVDSRPEEPDCFDRWPFVRHGG